MRYPKFTLRDFLWFVALAGVALAWFGDSYDKSRAARVDSERHREEMRRAEVVQTKLVKELIKAGYAVTIVDDQVSAVFVPDAAPPGTATENP